MDRSPGVAKTHYLLLVEDDAAEEGAFKVSHSESMEFTDEGEKQVIGREHS